MRWRKFGSSVCVCSFYAPHPGISESVRVAFWQELVVSAKHVRTTVDLPMVVANDVNVWHPHFNLGRSRSVDNLVVPFIDLLILSCGLRLLNSPDRPTHVTGAALDLMFVSSSYSGSMVVHNGALCYAQAPNCYPIMGSDHYLCVASAHLVRKTQNTTRNLPPLRDWSPTLLRAHDDLCTWADKVFSALHRSSPCCLARRLCVVDQLYNELLSVLAWFSPRQRSSSRRPQPQWWTRECFSACVARNGAWRNFQRNPSPDLHARSVHSGRSGNHV